MRFNPDLHILFRLMHRSHWPRRLRRRSTAARLLRSWVRIPNPTGGMDICLLCVVRKMSLRRDDHSSRGILPTVAHRCVWLRNLLWRGGHIPRWASEPEKIIIIIIIIWFRLMYVHWQPTASCIMLLWGSGGKLQVYRPKWHFRGNKSCHNYKHKGSNNAFLN
jgi:hypothetical protein